MTTATVSQNQSIVIRRTRLGSTALWIVQIGIAALLLYTGGSKLAGAPMMVALFDVIGIGQWFRVVTGLIEVVSAVGLLVPALAPFAALLVVPTMLGAIGTHLFIAGGSPAPAAVVFIGSLVIVWTRRHQLLSAVSEILRARA